MLSASPSRRRRFFTATLAAGIAAALATAAPAANAQPRDGSSVATPFDIPAQPLDPALRRFGREAGVQVVFRSAVAEGLRSMPVQGRLTPEQGLQALLRGTGLVARPIAPGSWAIEAAAPAAADVIVTDTLRVGASPIESTGRARDLRGKDDVFELDRSTVYSGREQVERYKGANPADLVKDLVGVFSGDARNSGALDINIRGIQGPGRVPVTIDGTEQALTVWRGYNGVGNRNYIDPNLIGGIQVIKGPGLVRDVHTGIGGAMVIKTLDVDDVLEEGERVGGEFKLEGSSNAVAPRLPRLHTGEDYRTVEGFPQASPASPYTDRTLRVDLKSRGGNNVFAGEDYAYRLALGARNEQVDVLAAYAYRDRGNYFSGTRGAGYYQQDGDRTLAEDYIRTLALAFKPGDEVPNTSSEQESWLLKATWHPGDDQLLRLTYRDTLSHYGEVMPSRIDSSSGAVQWPLSRVDAESWNLEYKYQPAGSRWLDVYANLWRTDTVSDTYSAGGFPNYAQGNPQWNPAWSPILKNTALANARSTRNGATLSNRFALADSLALTVGGNLQHETLRSEDAYFGASDGWRMYPRAGRRHEWEGYLDMEWRPVPALTLNAGMRYSSYWAFDDFLDAHPELQTASASNWEVRYRVAVPITAADVQADIDRWESSRAFWQSIGMGSVVDQSIAALRATIGNTRTVEQSRAWTPDAAGNYHRADNPCLNGEIAALPGIQPYHANGTDLCAVQTGSLTAVSGGNPRRRDHAWLPTFSATLQLSDTSRVYLRYAEAKRFPSMFESTIAFSSSFNPLYPLKPEHAHNMEVAYVHNLSGLFGGAATADVKLGYYVHKTRDVIERDNLFLFNNIDKQTLRGLELQARYDNGRFFGDLGATRTLENEVCDESSAVMLDRVRGQVPDCVQDGFLGGYLITQAVPRLSINASLGARLFADRLDVGGRVVHYRGHDNPDLDAYRAQKETRANLLWINVPFTWGSITTVDAYVSWKLAANATLDLVGSNLTNRYYVDPATRSAMAAPGRTLKLGFTARF
ncbi:TonB-dependent receptor domain-containing protein [Stenotrophomonas sp. LGBM10]|uniref:TonB-dependent receptor n=1 Tax=Stenotrophomonas sp. LGBM10 TaxID=3390038 RepID=UPI00398ADB60